MSNGRHTRRGGARAIRPPAHIVEAAARMRCPDCASEVSLRRRDGTWHVGVAHDDACVQLSWRRHHGALTGAALVAEPGRTIEASQIASLADALAAMPGVQVVRIATDAATSRSERQVLEAFLDPGEADPEVAS